MAIVSSDIKFYKSSSGDSEGGGISASEIVSGSQNNLWPDITDTEAAAGGTRYRKWFIQNGHATDDYAASSLWIAATPSQTVESIGLGVDSADDANAAQGNMTAFSAEDKVALVSSGSDTRTVTIIGANSSGTAIQEDVVLDGTNEVLSVGDFDRVYCASVSALAATTVTLKEGTGGTTRGTIDPNEKVCFIWLVPASKAAGILLQLISPGLSVAVWDRLVWSPGATAVSANNSSMALERV